jgi:hypothetical protein
MGVAVIERIKDLSILGNLLGAVYTSLFFRFCYLRIDCIRRTVLMEPSVGTHVRETEEQFSPLIQLLFPS